MGQDTDNKSTVALPARILGALAATAAARPRMTLWLVLLLACGSVGVTFNDMKLRTSRSDLVDPTTAFSRNWQEYKASFGITSDLVVVVETEESNATLIRSVLDDLGQRLEREPELFAHPLYRIEQRALRQKALQLLSPSELRTTMRRVEGFDPVVRNRQWDLIRTEALAARLRRQIVEAERNGKSAEHLYRYANQFAESLSHFMVVSSNGVVDASTFQSPWPDLVAVGTDDNVTDTDVAYLLNDAANVGLLQVFPVDQARQLAIHQKPIERLRELIAEVTAEHSTVSPDLKIALTGIPVLEHDEITHSTEDMQKAAAIAMVAVIALLVVGFRGVRHPMLALMTLVVAVCWTAGTATLVIGHLNIVSVCFVVILIGLGADFSIHFISRYLRLRADLHELPEAIRMTAETTGTGITTSAVTTALAFASAMLTGFPGLAELGLIAGIGILMCVLSTFIFLPALIAMSDMEVEFDQLPQPSDASTYRRLIVAKPVLVAVIGVAALIGGGLRGFKFVDGTAYCRVPYDANLMSLQNPNAESVVVADDLFSRTGESLLYAVAIADSMDEALRLRSEFINLPTVGRVSELASRLPNPPTPQQRAMIQQLQSRVASLPRTSPSMPAASFNQVGREVERLYFVLRKSPDRVARDAAILLDRFLDDLAGIPGSKASAILDSYQNLVARSLISEFAEISQAATLTPVTLRDLPPALKARYLRADENSQKWLIRVYPKEQLWQAEALATFVQEVRTVDPDITGVPVQHYESSTQLSRSYRTVALYALAIVSVILLFEFLRPGQKLMTILPPVAIAGFIGYTMFQRTGEVHPHLIVMIGMGLLLFIAAVLDYRNLRDTIIALLPAAGGAAVLIGAMAALNLSWNPVNLIVLPLLLGVGVDNGIHLVHDYRRQVARGAEYRPSADTVNGVLLTSLSSVIGFGSLIVSAHQGMFSLGLCMAIGISGCLVASLIPLPAILAIVARHQPPVMTPVTISASEDETSSQGSQAKKQSSQQTRKAA